ncbi:MAG TPA: hypothetical protein VFW30_05600 [Bryocella sp.]|nr:hypothetical protein [Bryocella sp.]
MSPLPTPGDFLDSADDFVEWLEQLHSAWENSGGDEEALMVTLITAGAITGIDETAVAALAGVTVLAYIAACATCLASATASAIWDLISSTDDSFIKDKLTVAANDQGIPKPDGGSQMA